MGWSVHHQAQNRLFAGIFFVEPADLLEITAPNRQTHGVYRS
jgi:hypothetical protein